jgi:hypothetical protein
MVAGRFSWRIKKVRGRRRNGRSWSDISHASLSQGENAVGSKSGYGFGHQRKTVTKNKVVKDSLFHLVAKKE